MIKGHGLIAKAKQCYEKAYEALENNRARRHNNLIFDGDYYQRKGETLIEEVYVRVIDQSQE